MRVNMKIEESLFKTSLFKTTSVQSVIVDIRLSEEEKAQVQHLALSDYQFITVPCFLPADIKINGEQRIITVAALINHEEYGPLRVLYPDLIHAQNGMAEVKESLTKLKEAMTNRTEVSNEQSFEL